MLATREGEVGDPTPIERVPQRSRDLARGVLGGGLGVGKSGDVGPEAAHGTISPAAASAGA